MRIQKINVYQKDPENCVSNQYKTGDLSLDGLGVHLINGCRGQGKSYLMSKILAQCKKERTYDRVYLISPSAQSNTAYFGKYIDKENIFKPDRDAIDIVVKLVENDRDEFEAYLEDVKRYEDLLVNINSLSDDVLFNAYEEGYINEKCQPIKPVWKYNEVRPPCSALILDDCLTSDALLKSTSKNTISTIGTYNRHLASLKEPHSNRSACGLSLYMLVQSYSCQNGIPRMLREQLTALTTFKVKQEKQLSKIKEEVSNVIDLEKFESAYNYAVNKPHGSLTISFNPKRPELTFRAGLDELILFDEM